MTNIYIYIYIIYYIIYIYILYIIYYIYILYYIYIILYIYVRAPCCQHDKETKAPLHDVHKCPCQPKLNLVKWQHVAASAEV